MVSRGALQAAASLVVEVVMAPSFSDYVKESILEGWSIDSPITDVVGSGGRIKFDAIVVDFDKGRVELTWKGKQIVYFDAPSAATLTLEGVTGSVSFTLT